MNLYVNFVFGIPNFGIGIPICQFFNSRIQKKIPTVISRIENGIGILLPMGVPEPKIGTPNQGHKITGWASKTTMWPHFTTLFALMQVPARRAQG
jgi:hypothetical protein